MSNFPQIRRVENAKQDADFAAVEAEIAETRKILAKDSVKSEAKILNELVAEVLEGIASLPDGKLQAMLNKPIYATRIPKIAAELERRAASRKADAELVLALSERAGTMATATLERLVLENTGALQRVAQDEIQRRAANC